MISSNVNTEERFSVMNKLNSRTISINALAIALVCLSTMFLQFPIPLGYAHLGNCFILISGVFFGPVTGLLAGGIGSALSDLLTGYAQWIIPTLIIKGINGLCVGYIANRTGLTANMFKIRTAIAGVVGIVIMVIGYFIGGSILYGSIYTGATQIPGLVMEGIIGILLFYVIGSALQAAHLPKYIQRLTQR